MMDVILKGTLYLIVLTGIAAYLTYFERKLLAYFQDRIGPNRAGPRGILQPLADAIKLFFKEDITPLKVTSKFLYFLAPILTATFAIVPFFLIPLYPSGPFPDINLSLLLIVILSSMGLYGVVFGGYSSASKYSVIGGIRGALMLLSFETSLLITILSVAYQAGSLSLREIVEAQKIPFIFPQFIGFLIFVITGFMETKRLPFDIPEAESELTGGFHTEYSSLKFAFFFLGEYLHILLVSSLIVTFYLAGWKFFFLPPFIGFILKVIPFVFFFIWVRASLPRFRFTDALEIGWKILLPLSFLNFLITLLWETLKGG
ncbi:MAG: NADH-quinone oxidoreductase subunit NuoH [candidate division WOR-3 bacterium]